MYHQGSQCINGWFHHLIKTDVPHEARDFTATLKAKKKMVSLPYHLLIVKTEHLPPTINSYTILPSISYDFLNIGSSLTWIMPRLFWSTAIIFITTPTDNKVPRVACLSPCRHSVTDDILFGLFPALCSRLMPSANHKQRPTKSTNMLDVKVSFFAGAVR